MPKRVEVKFSEQAYQALEEICAIRGMTLSEAVREATTLYRWFVVTRSQGRRILVERGDGTMREVISV